MITGIVYLAVTSDEFELPVAIADTLIELSSLLGKTPNALCSGYRRKKEVKNPQKQENVIKSRLGPVKIIKVDLLAAV